MSSVKWIQSYAAIYPGRIEYFYQPLLIIIIIYYYILLFLSTSIKPTLMYGCEIWPVTQRMEDGMDATEMRMLRQIYGISYEDHVENTDIRRQAGVKEMSSFMRKRRLQWHGHVCRRDEDEDIYQVTSIQVGGRRKRGRPQQRWKDIIELGASRTATR